MHTKICLVFVLLLLTAGIAQATTLSGYLNDTSNAALKWYDLSPAQFTDDLVIANNVALYDITIPVFSGVNFLSLGYAAGGIDPYFTLFKGKGDTATFLGSNWAQAITTGGDFNLTFNLSPGDYTVAIGVYDNESFAENLGVGTLKDGFIGLGESYLLGNYYYEVQITSSAPVPEPSTWLLVLPGMALIWWKRRR